MKKLLLLVFIVISGDLIAQNIMNNYVDLGLPSGTLWGRVNEENLYTYDQAIKMFGQNIPSKAQWDELMDYCEWNWNGRGYKVEGPSGKFIFLPITGVYTCDGSNIGNDGKSAGYWSSTTDGQENAFRLLYGPYGLGINAHDRCYHLAVRLVK